MGSRIIVSCYSCKTKSSKSFSGTPREITQKFEKFKKTYRCRKCKSGSFGWQMDYSSKGVYRKKR